MNPFVKVFFACILGASICVSSQSQVRFSPPDNSVVLNSSVHDKSAQNTKFIELSRAWLSKPQDLSVSVEYARTVFQMGLAEGDLRWFGAAKAAMLPWWKNEDLPADAFFMRGLVKQGFHDFTGGLADINKAIDLNPQKAEFWSWRFALHLLQTDLVAASQDCESIDRLFGQDESKVYRAILMYRTGKPQAAIDALNTLVGSPNFQSASSQEWLALHLGEAYRVAGQTELAVVGATGAIPSSQTNVWICGAYRCFVDAIYFGLQRAQRSCRKRPRSTFKISAQCTVLASRVTD
jgi:tetratricopeptide (TPR) repeat protein